MNSETIQLPDFLLAELYKDCLIEAEAPQAKLQQPQKASTKIVDEKIVVHEAKTLQYLGDNNSKIIFLVNEPDAPIVSDSDLAFVINILKACNLSLRNIAIVNTNKQDVLYLTLKEQLDAETILLFNIEPSSIHLPFSIPHFQVHKYAGCTVLTAPLLSVLNQSTEEGRLLKSKLWASLKQLFNI